MSSSRKSQAGFTLPELLAVVFGLLWLAAVCGVFYVVGHFISKFW